MAACVALIWAVWAIDPADGAELGLASWYQDGLKTANGERYRPDELTCARRRGRFGLMLRVTDIATKKSIICRLNDRGPALWTHRSIDLSRGSAHALGIIQRGVAQVSIEIVR